MSTCRIPVSEDEVAAGTVTPCSFPAESPGQPAISTYIVRLLEQVFDIAMLAA